MATIAATTIGLRIFGDDLVPDAVTAALGKSPTQCRTKGELIPSKSGNSRLAKTGSWHYRVERREPGDLDGQISELFGALTADLSVWRALVATYKVDLFVGFFMSEENEGIEISAASMETLSSRGIVLGLDVYAPSNSSNG